MPFKSFFDFLNVKIQTIYALFRLILSNERADQWCVGTCLFSSLFIFFGVWVSAWAGDPQVPPFDMNSLKEIIARNNVKSVDELLPFLPEELRSNFTLVYKSQSSLQTGTVENPRAILFGKNGPHS